MELIVKTYPEELTEFDFYGYMGKYFAEPKYKKELPYMNHNENRHWRLYFNEKGEFIGFSSYELRKHYTYLTSTLIVEELRGKKIGKKIINELIDLFPNKTLKCVSKSPQALKVLKNKNFHCVGYNGKYERLVRWCEDD